MPRNTSRDRTLNRRSILLGITTFALASALGASAQAQMPPAQKPSILFILVDKGDGIRGSPERHFSHRCHAQTARRVKLSRRPTLAA